MNNFWTGFEKRARLFLGPRDRQMTKEESIKFRKGALNEKIPLMVNNQNDSVVLFHGSPPENHEEIMKNGLRTDTTPNKHSIPAGYAAPPMKDVIFLTTSPRYAANFGSITRKGELLDYTSANIYMVQLPRKDAVKYLRKRGTETISRAGQPMVASSYHSTNHISTKHIQPIDFKTAEKMMSFFPREPL